MIQFTSREKYYLFGAGIVCLVFILFQFIFFPVMDRQKRMQQLITEKRKELQQVQTMRQQYLALTGSGTPLPHPGHGSEQNPLSLFSIIEDTAKSAKLSANIEYMQPVFNEGTQKEDDVSVEMKMDNLSMQEVVNFLSGLQSRINIKRFDLQKNNRNLLELIATLAVRQSR